MLIFVLGFLFTPLLPGSDLAQLAHLDAQSSGNITSLGTHVQGTFVEKAWLFPLGEGSLMGLAYNQKRVNMLLWYWPESPQAVLPSQRAASLVALWRGTVEGVRLDWQPCANPFRNERGQPLMVYHDELFLNPPDATQRQEVSLN